MHKGLCFLIVIAVFAIIMYVINKLIFLAVVAVALYAFIAWLTPKKSEHSHTLTDLEFRHSEMERMADEHYENEKMGIEP